MNIDASGKDLGFQVKLRLNGRAEVLKLFCKKE